MNRNGEKCRVFIASPGGEEMRRIDQFARRMGFSVLKAHTPETVAQMIGVVSLDVVIVDESFDGVLAQIARIHPNARRFVMVESLRSETDADRILKKPLDLFVLERLLGELVPEEVAGDRGGEAVHEEPEREPSRA